MNAVLFDIDGTLVDSTDLDTECYLRAVRTVLGDVYIRPQWDAYKDVTALAILKDILEDNHLSPRNGLLKTVREEFGRTISSALRDNGLCYAREGAIDTLAFLKRDNRVQIALATGDWSHTAGMKLAYAGVDSEGIPLSSSDQKEKRPEIMLDALGKLEGPFEEIFYVGDGEWDQKASQDLGWNFIGIGPNLKGRCRWWHETFDLEFRNRLVSQR